MNEKTCENCRFGRRVEYEYKPDKIACHRDAPAPIQQPLDDHWDFFEVVWPHMDLDDWCGEFDPVDPSR
jgi:hypothetical protein